MPAIVEFVSSIGQDPEFDEDIVKIAVDLLGDLCSVIQVGKDWTCCAPGIPQFIRTCSHAGLSSDFLQFLRTLSRHSPKHTFSESILDCGMSGTL